MAGLRMKSFLLKVTGERSTSGHLWLSAALSFVIAHLRVLVGGRVHLIVGVLSACGLTPVGNRLSRLILALPAACRQGQRGMMGGRDKQRGHTRRGTALHGCTTCM